MQLLDIRPFLSKGPGKYDDIELKLPNYNFSVNISGIVVFDHLLPCSVIVHYPTIKNTVLVYKLQNTVDTC